MPSYVSVKSVAGILKYIKVYYRTKPNKVILHFLLFDTATGHDVAPVVVE